MRGYTQTEEGLITNLAISLQSEFHFDFFLTDITKTLKWKIRRYYLLLCITLAFVLGDLQIRYKK